mmetsp:Transcript_10931/g.23162  ORF Transcript_10931/g.23162 Transcript_10931/m.23162 type:complete len:102 (+) Transcript_10931:1200-1505(+)
MQAGQVSILTTEAFILPVVACIIRLWRVWHDLEAETSDSTSMYCSMVGQHLESAFIGAVIASQGGRFKAEESWRQHIISYLAARTVAQRDGVMPFSPTRCD